MTANLLQQLTDGMSIGGDSGNRMERIPDWMDRARLLRGQRFFANHSMSVINSLHCSLTVGFAVDRLTSVLMFSRASDTPSKARRRYLETFVHVVLWLTTDIWDPTSLGHRSLAFVRRVHGRAARIINSSDSQQKSNAASLADTGDNIRISQYDMALVQSAFVGIIVTHPANFGASESDLGDFVFLWRCVGYLLGIDDRYNICSGDLDSTRAVVRNIWNELVYPRLLRPSDAFHLLADAYIDGMNGLWLGGGRWLMPASKKSTIAFTIECMEFGGACVNHELQQAMMPDWVQELGWLDQLRIRLMKINVWLLWHCPGYARLLNRIVVGVMFRFWLPKVECRQLAIPNLDHVD